MNKKINTVWTRTNHTICFSNKIICQKVKKKFVTKYYVRNVDQNHYRFDFIFFLIQQNSNYRQFLFFGQKKRKN